MENIEQVLRIKFKLSNLLTLPQIKITQILKRVNYITQTLNSITAHLTRRPHLIIYEDSI